MFGRSFQQSTYLGYLALIRIAVGYHFTAVALRKVFYGFDEMTQQILAGVPNDVISLHREFIVNWVIPNSFWFKYFVTYSELAIGMSLLTGCLVRVSSLFGAFYNLNIYLAVAAGPAQVGINLTFIIIQLVFAASCAGRSLGLDGWLHRKFPRS